MKKFKHIDPPKKNMAKLVLNVGGKIIESEKPIEEIMSKRYGSVPCIEGEVCECKRDYPEVISYEPPFELVEQPDIEEVKPVFKYARSAACDTFMEPIVIGVTQDEDTGKRDLWQIFEDGVTVPFEDIAIIGDDYGPIGMLVPFTANTEAIGAAANLFGEIYDNRMKGIPDGKSTVRAIKALGPF